MCRGKVKARLGYARLKVTAYGRCQLTLEKSIVIAYEHA